MYKTTSDNHDYLGRVGSHATKEHRTGRIDNIPQWAAEPEEYYNTLRDQYRSLVEQLHKTQNRLAEIRERLRVTLPHKDYQHWSQQKEALTAKVVLLEQQVINYRPLVRALGEKAWATVFFHVAMQLLNPDDLRVLRNETDELLGRTPFEISKGRGQLTPEQHDRAAKRDSRRERRVRFRKQQGKSVLVWSDEDEERQK